MTTSGREADNQGTNRTGHVWFNETPKLGVRKTGSRPLSRLARKGHASRATSEGFRDLEGAASRLTLHSRLFELGTEMDAFFDSLIARTATIDELLSDAFEPLPGRKDDSDLATRRLADWCRSCAGGDWSLFNRRLERDGLSFAEVLARFATVRPAANALRPAWISDAVWIEAALRTVHNDGPTTIPGLEPVPFEHLLAPLVEQAKSRLRSEMGERAFVNLNESSHA